MLRATHIIVFGEKIVFCDVGAQQGVAHQVDKAQTQALESRYGAGKEQVGSHTAEPRPSPSDLQSRKGAFQGVQGRVPVPKAVSREELCVLANCNPSSRPESRRGQCVGACINPQSTGILTGW